MLNIKRNYFTIKEYFIFAIIVIGLFQLPLIQINHIFSFFDEFITLFFIFYILYHIIFRRNLEKTYYHMLLLIGLIILEGLISTYLADINVNFIAIIMDISYITKLFLCYIGVMIFLNDKFIRSRNILSVLAGIVKIIIFVALFLLPFSTAGIIPFSHAERFGIRTYGFIYAQPGMLSQYCIAFLLILTADKGSNKSKNNWSIVGLLIVWAFTFRARAFAVIFVYIFLYIIVSTNAIENLSYKKRLKKVFKKSYVVLFVLISILVGRNQLKLYFVSGRFKTARSILLYYGFAILKRYFPFGAGFASFGTEAAGRYYSQLYYEYGINFFWGLREGGSELTDCYWPAIFAELGAIGGGLMIALIYLLLRDMIKKSVYDKWILVAVVTFVFMIIISSFATGSFCSYTNTDFMIIVGMIINCKGNMSNGKYCTV